MSQVLRGNFTPKQPVQVERPADDLSTQFEREALRRLGGSIAFVSKKKFLYAPDADRSGGKATGPDDQT